MHTKLVYWWILALTCGRLMANDHPGSAVTAPGGSAGTHGGEVDVSIGKGASEVEMLLRQGNQRFIHEASEYPRQGYNRRLETSTDGQHPIATVLTCSDSRVSPEFIFDMGIGDLFVIRVAGNIADAAELASVEYGAGHLGTPLVMVLGHTKCGAVTAVATRTQVGGNLPSLVDNIVPAVTVVEKQQPGIKGEELINRAIKQNVWQTIEDILKYSPEIRHLLRGGKVKLVGALYDIESGKVQHLGVHLNQENLLKKYK